MSGVNKVPPDFDFQRGATHERVPYRLTIDGHYLPSNELSTNPESLGYVRLRRYNGTTS